MPAIDFRYLTKTYGDRRALDGFSLSVEEGECLALLGPNGAGKSTLIDILATLQEPTDGEVRVMGASVGEEAHAVRQRVGVAFQTPITHDHLSARELVLHQARIYDVPSDVARERTEELLAFVDLAERADDRISTFSEGMKRRADLARVLVTEPDVLLLDEPAAGLDPRGRRTIRERLATLARQGTTLLVATHQMRELGPVADRVAIMHEGRIEALDTPEALTDELGERLIHVRLPEGADLEPVRQRLEGLGVSDVRRHGHGLETVLGADDVSAGRIVDDLEEAGLTVEEVAIREPDLGDAFLSLTGTPLDADTGDEEGLA
ncbi:daunorubicin/doxorubicin resistance ABC transporter ATP-binding protein DrrA [Thermoplasmatales archaeon SW_10_69_26]|nr:MAG: daunorubicin/doxorubicin resistance ABC transporter ATP-binding protein DrrA [Thermoplasmatales archaeon SW_10_69_26]